MTNPTLTLSSPSEAPPEPLRVLCPRCLGTGVVPETEMLPIPGWLRGYGPSSEAWEVDAQCDACNGHGRLRPFGEELEPEDLKFILDRLVRVFCEPETSRARQRAERELRSFLGDFLVNGRLEVA